ncbi:MAG: peptide-methionine (S)-S-oxide reductase MsrA [Candidatus Marinimicrobia bacterium]|nr:peptide-methionine (S)-S-oxide reductase MsrA [Candidatus Neomarinimicrobiota bacterium]MBT3502232.1 peptide-methionine (S)-S-oxide reductase MsrA [Candidatus Neomarinimicrobiota bacterium]MBT3838730.1 peptide-methionine (S)-S-oxide reductase MsrA [Candidatus Neomarinimicrobiota bacterium]MBT3998655.1 peptide-methionine (S)-S-oxide reductase MsrA [Candidatus Neomarinimicrobiota bacterium]MBT4282885.1 peptide-methionine (S)-S-oxide reductase MsrA [Candidatus Neomarinimicrobiota bacterium]
MIFSQDSSMKQTETATLGGGCFWCVEAVYQRVEGVLSVKPGYAGGHINNPTYKDVCSGNTGHAEVAKIEFDPNQISFKQILNVFWQAHDPTTLNKQGGDVGTQYRSVIFYHSDEQKNLASLSLEEADKSGYWDSKIVTEITALNNYTDAEDYHDNYYAENPNQGYCLYVIKPKLDKLEKRGIIK